MQIYDVPTSTLVARGINLGSLEQALSKILKEARADTFVHSEPVHGGKGSIRILSSVPLAQGIALPRPLNALGAAQEWVRFAEREARYPGGPTDEGIKGWMVRSTILNERPAAVIWAEWH